MPQGRFTRSTSDKKLGGVCAGLARYFGIDTLLVRILAVVSLFLGGAGLIAYILMWIFVPKDTDVKA